MVEAMECQVVLHSPGNEGMGVSFVEFYFLKGLLMDDASYPRAKESNIWCIRRYKGKHASHNKNSVWYSSLQSKLCCHGNTGGTL